MRYALQLLFVTLIVLNTVTINTDRSYAESAPAAGSEEQVYIPKDLDDCLVQLLMLLDSEDIQAIKSSTEDEMSLYHFSLGTWLRNNWGLWEGSRLSVWFNSIGIYHPDDMSGIILVSFWRYLNGNPLDLDGQIAQYKEYWEEQARQNDVEAIRTQSARERIASMMLELTFISEHPQTLALPGRLSYEMLDASFMAPYRNGVLVVVNNGDPNAPEEAGLFYDPQQGKLQFVVIPEMEQVQSIVVVDNTAWFTGQSGSDRAVLLAVNESRRDWVELPQNEETPKLGIAGDKLLAIYSNAVYQLDGDKWALLYSGDLPVPKLTSPPRKLGKHLIFFNDGPYNMSRELQLLDLTSGLVTSVQQELDVIRPDGPRWETAVSYTLTAQGDLWVAFSHLDNRSLVRREPDGKYSIAIINNGVQFDGHLMGSTETDLGLSVSAINVQSDNQIILFGDQGIYNLSDDTINQLLAFQNTAQKIPVVVAGHNSVYHWNWIPNEVAAIDQDTFVIAGLYGGIYLLTPDQLGQYNISVLDENIDNVIYM